MKEKLAYAVKDQTNEHRAKYNAKTSVSFIKEMEMLHVVNTIHYAAV